MNHELEHAAVMQPYRREVTNVPRRDAADADRVGERYDGGIYQAEMKVCVALASFHRPDELIARRGGLT